MERVYSFSKHNSNRHFPSKTVTFELDVKKAEVEKQQKEREREKTAKKATAAMVSVPLGAPPTYAESRKDVVLASNVMPNNAPEKRQLVAKAVQISEKPNQTSTTTASVSTTQNESAAGSLKAGVIPRLVPQGREEKDEAPMPTQLPATASLASSLPVSAKPPTLPSNKYTVNAPKGRRPPSRTQKKPTVKRKTQWIVGSAGGSSTTTGTVLSMSSPTESQRMNADDDSKLETAKVNLFLAAFLMVRLRAET
ncbi:unnamed protein product [Angiostrongylus costaricensis]|uniref:Flocculation protein FLO11-like n=1 Tax=Angiostrongylus costaricensis TaxID=334426 RepID=A0A158PHB4_ANGCS|nr:unnamed protein product [Angiostrongylus costaricensis]